MRPLLVLFLVLASCPGSRQICCQIPSGEIGLTMDYLCEEAEGESIDEEFCSEIGDPDLALPPEDTTPDQAAPTCVAFCAQILEVCPSDSACEHSCDDAPNAPSTDAVQCAADAADCPSTGACWDLLGL